MATYNIPTSRTRRSRRRRGSTTQTSSGFSGSLSGLSVPNFGAKTTAAQRRANILAGYLAQQANPDEGFGLEDISSTIGNFFGSAKDAFTGIPGGLYNTFTQNPLTTGEQFVDTMETLFDPEAFGWLSPLTPFALIKDGIDRKFDTNLIPNPGKIGELIEEHAFDYALFAVPGVGAAGRVATAAAKAGRGPAFVQRMGTAPKLKTFEVGRGKKINLDKQFSANPYERMWEQVGIQITKRVPVETPFFGGNRRARGPSLRQVEAKSMYLESALRQTEHTFGKLDEGERRAISIYAQHGREWKKVVPHIIAKGELREGGLTYTQKQFDQAKPFLEAIERNDPDMTEKWAVAKEHLDKAENLTAAAHGMSVPQQRARALAPAMDVNGVRPVRLKDDRVGTTPDPFVNEASSIFQSPRAQYSSAREFMEANPEYLLFRADEVLEPLDPTDLENGQWVRSPLQGMIPSGYANVGAVAPDGTQGPLFLVRDDLIEDLDVVSAAETHLDNMEAAVKSVIGHAPVYIPARPHDMGEFGKAAKFTEYKGTLLKTGLQNWDVNVALYDLSAAIKATNSEAIRQLAWERAIPWPNDKAKPKGTTWARPKPSNITEQRLFASGPRSSEGFSDAEIKSRAQKIMETITSDERIEDANGEARLIPESFVESLQTKYAYEEGTYQAWASNAMQVWKVFTLFSGRFAVNNFVGGMMLMGLTHPTALPGVVRSFVNQAHRAKGIKVGGETLTMYEHFPHTTQGFGATERIGEVVSTGKVGRAKHWANLMYRVVGAMEEAFREATMVRIAMQNPVVRKRVTELKREGFQSTLDNTTLNQALKDVLNKPEGRGVWEGMHQELDRVFGDYRNYTQNERRIRRYVAPFYSWFRHITRTTGSMTLKNPVTISALGIVGSMYDGDAAMPEFMRQYIALGDVDPDTQIQHFWNLGGANPFSTVADVTDLAGAVFLGEPGEIGSGVTAGLSPFLTGAIEFKTGESLLTGAPLRDDNSGGALGNVLLRQFQNAGILGAVYRSLNQPDYTPDSPDELYTPTGQKKDPPQRFINNDLKWNLLNVAGVPIREVDRDVAESMGRAERGERKPRKPKRVQNSFGSGFSGSLRGFDGS